jgi:hypothetical protein
MRPKPEASEDWGDLLDDVDVGGRASGTRRVATAHTPRTPPQVHPSQRPTMRAPPELIERLTVSEQPSASLPLGPKEVPLLKRPPRDGEVDHIGGFLLSRIDGQSTVEELVDVSGMPSAQAMRVIASLWQRGLIHFR